MSLREKLKALEELQKLDLEINGIREQAKTIPKSRVGLESVIAETRQAYDQEKARLADSERERRQVETLLAMERDKVKKWEGRLGEIRTPREYAALSREIDIAKKTNENQSEQLKQLLAQAAEMKRGLEAREEALAEKEESVQSDLTALKKRESELKDALKKLESRRVEMSKQVDPSLLAKYENIRRRRAGVAVAPVVGSTCRGCNRNIPPQLNIVLQRADSIETCPNCHRIIYSAEAVNPPSSSPE